MRPAINTSIRLRLIASVLAISPMKKGCKFMRRLFFVVAFLISFPACAAMNGFLTNGLCFPDTASALESFASNYPKIENGFQYAIYSTLTTVTNYQYSMRVDNLAAGTNYSFTKAPFLTACDTTLNVSPVIDAPGILAVFTWGFAVIVLFFFWGFVIAVAVNVINQL